MITKILLYITILISSPFYAYAQDDIQFKSVFPRGIEGLSDTSTTDSFLNDLFVIFIVVAVILAVIRLMICGIKYMTSESVSSKGAAKTCIQYVVGGLLLALTSYIILATINEDITGSSIANITSKVDVGNVTELDSNITLDMRVLDGDVLPSENTKTVYGFVVAKHFACGGATTQKAYETRSQCKKELKSMLSIPRFDGISGCEQTSEGDGLFELANYSFTYRDVCGGDNITEELDNKVSCESTKNEILDADDNPLYEEIEGGFIGDALDVFDWFACDVGEEEIE